MKGKNLNWMLNLFRHYFFSFLILTPVMFSASLFFDWIGLNPDLILLKLEGAFLLHGLRRILFWFFGFKVPIYLLSLVGSLVGASLHMQDPAGGQPAADQRLQAPEPSTSSSWSGSWIQEWFSRGDSSSAQNEGAQEANTAGTGTSSQAAANPELAPPQLPQPPGHQPPIQPGEHLEKVNFENYIKIADVIQEIHHDLNKRVPGGFQASRLAEMLEERHGAERMNEMLHSLRTERNLSPYFAEVQTDFRTLRDSGGTEMQLRKEWQGRA